MDVQEKEIQVILLKKACSLWVMTMVFLSLLLDFTAQAITVKEEEDLGHEFIRVIKRQYDIVSDPYVSQYIENLGQRLLKQFPSQPLTYHFYVIKQDVYNAFAGPGGHVFVNSGLIEAMDSDEELLGILSHEISHVVCRHISEKIDRSSKIELATLAGLAAGIFLGVGGSGSAAQAVTVGTMAAGQSLNLAYSRDDEREADKVGLEHMEKAGYGPEGLIRILKKIKAKNWYGYEIPTYLTTHPATDERIVYLSRQLEDQRTADSKVSARVTDDFKKFLMRITALYGDKEKAIALFGDMLAKDDGDYLANHGMGLVLSREGHQKDARRFLKKALEKQAFDPYLLTDLGRAYYLNGDFDLALGTLKSAVTLDAKNKEGGLLLGRTQVELNALEDAARTFRQLILNDPDYASAYYYLGDAYNRLNQSAPAHYYLGMSYKIKGDYPKALFNLKKAKADASDTEIKEKIEAAMEEIEAEKKKNKKK